MKPPTQIFRVVQFVCLLTFACVFAEDNFKDEFGEKFGVALKRINANLLQSNMDSMKEFYKQAIGENNLEARDERAFRQRYESIDRIKERIGDSVTPDSVKAAASFSKLAIFELFMFRASPTIQADPVRSSVFDAAMKKSAEQEVENVSKFIQDMQRNWNDLYPTIPQNELEKHPEFEEINESIDNLARMDGTFDNVVPRTMALVETLRKISTFFDYSEWNILLQKKMPRT